MRRPNGRLSRLSANEFRAVVGHALLHMNDIVELEDSPLVELAQVRRRADGTTALFAEGQAVSEILNELVLQLIGRLAGSGKVALIRATLEGVARNDSIARIAREHGKTREHWSRHYWQMAVGLVASEISALNGVPPSGTLTAGHGNRVPNFQNSGVLEKEHSA